MMKKVFLASVVLSILGGCTTIPQNQTFIPSTQVVQKPVIISPPPLKMNYSFMYGNNPALKRAYDTYLRTGKTPNIETEGFVQFAYGTGNQPIVAASPFELTVISLEPGENITNVSSGDPTRWSYSMAYSGAGKNRQGHIMIKPSAQNISTDFAITTDKRLYTLKLVSGAIGQKYVRDVRFWYPDEAQAFWDNYNAQESQKITQGDTVAEVPNLNVNNLNFDYSISCGGFFSCPSWKPTRVFDDGTHTYIQFGCDISNKDMPALFVLTGSTKELVNYRAKAPYFIVDKIFKQAVLVVGVGTNQSKVIISNNRYS